MEFKNPRHEDYIIVGDWVIGFQPRKPVALPEGVYLPGHFAQVARAEDDAGVRTALKQFYGHYGLLGHEVIVETAEGDSVDWVRSHSILAYLVLSLCRPGNKKLVSELLESTERVASIVPEKTHDMPRELARQLRLNPTDDNARRVASALVELNLTDTYKGIVLIDLVYRQMAAALDAGHPVAMCECKALFFVQHRAQKSCPPWPEQRESRCAKRLYMRSYRRGFRVRRGRSDSFES
jgi:hypothetical protein